MRGVHVEVKDRMRGGKKVELRGSALIGNKSDIT